MGLKPPLEGIKRYVNAKWSAKVYKSFHFFKDGIFLFEFHTKEEMNSVLNERPWHYYECSSILQICIPRLDIDITNVMDYDYGYGSQISDCI